MRVLSRRKTQKKRWKKAGLHFWSPSCQRTTLQRKDSGRRWRRHLDPRRKKSFHCRWFILAQQKRMWKNISLKYLLRCCCFSQKWFGEIAQQLSIFWKGWRHARDTSNLQKPEIQSMNKKINTTQLTWRDNGENWSQGRLDYHQWKPKDISWSSTYFQTVAI